MKPQIIESSTYDFHNNRRILNTLVLIVLNGKIFFFLAPFTFSVNRIANVHLQ